MKLPSLMQKSAAVKLEAVQAARAGAQEKLATLEQKRAAALVDSDSVDVLVQLSAAITQQSAIVGACDQQIVVLTAKVQEEAVEQRQRDYLAGVGKIETALSKRAEAADRVALAIKALGTAVRHFDDTSAAIIRNWPDSVPHFFTDWRLNRDGLADLIRAACSNPADINADGPRIILTSDGAAFVSQSDFAATERQRHAELIVDLRERGAPELVPAPEPEEPEPEAPAAEPEQEAEIPLHFLPASYFRSAPAPVDEQEGADVGAAPLEDSFDEAEQSEARL